MADTTQSAKQSVFQKPLVRVVILIIGLGLLVSGIVKIFNSGDKTKVSDEFINKFNQVLSLSNEIASGKTLTETLAPLPEKDQAKDYSGAAKILSEAVDQLNGWKSKTNQLKGLFIELKDLSRQITDTDVKTSALELVDLMDQRADLFLAVMADQLSLLSPTKTYYENLAAGKKAVPLPDQQIAAVNARINSEVERMNQLIETINKKQEDFAKLAGISVSK
ncbi:YkyA family protein [Candidatus Uhrbacteria bacterium]|nr:YkyA family protein [Candidatus Uhrbacteria bacterium]